MNFEIVQNILIPRNYTEILRTNTDTHKYLSLTTV
jgi:hypothetical protein